CALVARRAGWVNLAGWPGVLRGDDDPGRGGQMKPLSMHRHLAAVLAVAAVAAALTAWSHEARPAARVLSCPTVPGVSGPAAGGQKPGWDMPSVPGILNGVAAWSSSNAVAVGDTLLADSA